MIGYDADSPDDDVEVELNREVDRAERNVRMGPDRENPYFNESPEDLVARIERCSNEIKSVLPFIAPSKSTVPLGPDLQTPQDERVLCSAKELLKKEVEALCDLVEALI
jgi:hypothetical protein